MRCEILVNGVVVESFVGAQGASTVLILYAHAPGMRALLWAALGRVFGGRPSCPERYRVMGTVSRPGGPMNHLTDHDIVTVRVRET